MLYIYMFVTWIYLWNYRSFFFFFSYLSLWFVFCFALLCSPARTFGTSVFVRFLCMWHLGHLFGSKVLFWTRTADVENCLLCFQSGTPTAPAWGCRWARRSCTQRRWWAKTNMCPKTQIAVSWTTSLTRPSPLCNPTCSRLVLAYSKIL